MGYSDWNRKSPLGPIRLNNILLGACWEANTQKALFALEIAGVDPNLEGIRGRSALGNAAGAGFLKGAVMLVECVATVDPSNESLDGTPLIRSSGSEMRLHTDLSHYLLLQRANPKLQTNYGESALALYLERILW
jgi:hypothetical protein